ncbi:MAG: hypothetical protein OEU54_02795 [Gemmatimonadota bacterium]|nr:hypothetical protein [Gemmatimonadota bacterium]
MDPEQIRHQEVARELALAMTADRPAITACLACLALAVVAPAVQGQQTDPRLIELLETNRHPVAITSGRLAGSGGELLTGAGRASRFVLVGEEHGIAEIPLFTAAWFRSLVPWGYRHLAVEVGPDAGVLLDSLARVGPRALAEFQEARSPGFPFFILESESRLLVDAVSELPDVDDVIWGIDYDILGDRYLFPVLEAAARDDDARKVVAEVREMADAGLSQVIETGNPGALLLWSAPDDPFIRLREAIDPEPGSRADRVIETMQETARINRLFLSGQNWDSNHARAGWLKLSMSRHLDAARTRGEAHPRALVKLGANHAYRGLNQTRQYDVGTMLAQVAEAEGSGSFHLLVVGGPDTRRSQFNPIALSYETEAAGMLSVILPTQALVLPDAWTLFDFRPFRAAIHERRVDVTQELFDLVFNFDAVLVMTGSTPARPWFDPGVALRR